MQQEKKNRYSRVVRKNINIKKPINGLWGVQGNIFYQLKVKDNFMQDPFIWFLF